VAADRAPVVKGKGALGKLWYYALVAVGLYVFAAGFLYLVQDRIIYPAPRGGAADPKDAGVVGGERLEVDSGGESGVPAVKLHGWFLRAPSRNSREAPTIVVFHGNGENVTLDAGWLEWLRTLDVNVVAVDYRGYGLSGGSPSEAGLIEDGLATLRALRERGRVNVDKVVLLGSSIGSGVAIAVAEKERVAGLVLQSPFDSLRNVARRSFPIFPSILVRSPFDSLARVDSVSCPIFVAHGDRDTIVPIEHGERLYAAIPNKAGFLKISGAGHNDVISVGGDAYLERIRAFVRAVAK
jgi:fermentation-respiration switch protein FrsA (DUF1100 family)